MSKAPEIEEHPMMKRYINYYKKCKEVKLCYLLAANNFVFSFIIAPFQTLSISRQLSVTPHKEIYGDYVDPKKSNALTKISTDVTLREARNYELIKSSGVINGQKPYRAPIYDNYRETFRGIYRQGILGFYKGNFWRIITYSVSQRMKISLDWFFRERYEFFNHVNFIKDWICLSITDSICHVGFLVETRYVLQNRLPQFQVYSSIMKFKSRSYHEFTKGIFCHIPKNFLFLSGFYFYYIMPTTGNFMFAIFTGNILSYPLMTAFRRIVCESNSMPGMLPMRYLNLLHAIFLIRREEGLFRGLYKGFFAHIIATSLWVILVPSTAFFMYYQNQQKEDQQYFVNDPIFDAIKKRKYENILNSK